MRSINRHDVHDLARLAEGVEIIMGGGPDGELSTSHLYVYFAGGFRLPVYSDRVGAVIGHFQWSDKDEDVIYVPVKS